MATLLAINGSATSFQHNTTRRPSIIKLGLRPIATLEAQKGRRAALSTEGKDPMRPKGNSTAAAASIQRLNRCFPEKESARSHCCTRRAPAARCTRLLVWSRNIRLRVSCGKCEREHGLAVASRKESPSSELDLLATNMAFRTNRSRKATCLWSTSM